jgi:hypothetical protein
MTGTFARDLPAAAGVGLVVGLGYFLTFSTVPTSDGPSFVTAIDAAVTAGHRIIPVISNAPFSYYLVFLLKQLAVAVHLNVGTLQIFQDVNALVSAIGCVFFYLTVRGVGGAHFWAVLATSLMAGSYGVWYFANGEVHHVSLAILIFLFYRLMLERRTTAGPVRYGALIALGCLNAVAVFFHQEHFLFGWVAIALLFWRRPWQRAIKEAAAYGLAGTLGTAALIASVGWFAIGARSVRAIVGWYFWQIGYLVHDYQPEALWLIGLRLVKGQATAFLFGVQALADAAREPALLALPVAQLLAALTLATFALAALLICALWAGRRWLDGELSALVIGALTWLIVYPLFLSWYFPAVTEYYLKTVPPLVLLLVAGPLALERAGRPTRGSRAVALALLVLLVGGNAWSAIVPWYRYGLMRQGLEAFAVGALRPGDLVVSMESGIDGVFVGRAEQLRVKELLRKEGKERGFETVRSQIAARLAQGHRVLVYNLLPSRWALPGLNDNDPLWNPSRDVYEVRDFDGLLGQIRANHQVTPVLEYWEEAKEPLYLFGRRLEPLYEVRERS